MDLFDWLLLGHLVADWMLQNDWMARNKQHGWFNRAILLHCIVYTLTLLTTVWLSQAGLRDERQVLFFGAILFVSHWLIDAGNLAGRWVGLMRQTRNQFVQIMVDQTMHVLVLVILVQTLVVFN